MVYFTRITVDPYGNRAIEIAVSEDVQYIEQFEAKGFVTCSFEAFREAWRQRHTEMFERLHAMAVAEAPKAREVGA